MRKKQGFKKRGILIPLLVIGMIMAGVFLHFGGFGTGESINPEEFKKVARSIDDIEIPENVRIIALGEATHGNVEFQELKLDVFKQLVEEGVKAFAIEGDYGGCEKVNEYIQNGIGDLKEVVQYIGFQIYHTEQIAELISYMKEYNETVDEEQKLRFYGFDMQRYMLNVEYLKEECERLEIDTDGLEKLLKGDTWNEEFDVDDRYKVINKIKSEAESKENSHRAIHLADILLQHLAINTDNEDASFLRDRFMAENVKWILQQEEQLGHHQIFISGHNTHVAKYASMETMGNLLFHEMADAYYVIGTDFYKAEVNLPSQSKTSRINKTFYSHDPLAKTAKLAGIDRCWLDFSMIPEESELYALISNYNYMGSVGEAYSFVMRLIPMSYRIFQEPATLYDGMILISECTPTEVRIN